MDTNKLKRRVIIVAPDFPYNTPKALRIRAFAKLFNEIGFESVVICYFYRPSDNNELNQLPGVKRIIPIIPTPQGKDKLLLSFAYRKLLLQTVRDFKPDLIFTCALPETINTSIRIAKSCDIPIILECCEWYDETTFKHGRFDTHYLSHCYSWNHYYPKVDGVIAISRMIEKRYRELNIPVLRIPSITETDNLEYRITCASKQNYSFLFAGAIARTKDSIRPYFEALEKCDNKRSLTFDIVGVNEAEVIDHLGQELYQKFKSNIHIHGFVQQTLINQLYRNSDFGIFFRPHKRTSEAGFSTKLAEGMAAGTPFIINDTGDISLYIKHGQNGFIVNSVKDIVDIFNYIAEIDNAQLTCLRSNARKTAEEFFDYHAYINAFNLFVSGIMKGISNE